MKDLGDGSCFENPSPECLSGVSEHIDADITQKIFSLPQNTAQFRCLYTSWLDIEQLFSDYLPRKFHKTIGIIHHLKPY